MQIYVYQKESKPLKMCSLTKGDAKQGKISNNKDKENECEAYSRKLHINVCEILLKIVNEI